MRERGGRENGGRRELEDRPSFNHLGVYSFSGMYQKLKDRPILQALMCMLIGYALKAQGNRSIIQGLMCMCLLLRAKGNRPIHQ